MGFIKQTPAPRLRGSSAFYGATWRTFSPVVYRYMDRQYIDAFFEDGSLRLTSLAKCKQHTDEQRLDREEGSLRLITRCTETGAATFRELQMTDNPYILCTTLWHNEILMLDFGCNSYMRIHDPAEFGIRVSKHIPGFSSGGEGPCMYQHLRLIDVSLQQLTKPGASASEKHDQSKVAALIQQYAIFLKHKSFSHQAEYRLVWHSDISTREDYLDIKVPEAIELCSREGVFELEDFGETSPTR